MRDWLASQGWRVTDPPPELKYVDVMGERDGDRIYAEVKGRTTAPGLDVDTAYGQLLGRMPQFEDKSVRYALVVPTTAQAAALRVHARVREALRIDVFSVDERGGMQQVG